MQFKSVLAIVALISCSTSVMAAPIVSLSADVFKRTDIEFMIPYASHQTTSYLHFRSFINFYLYHLATTFILVR